MAISVFPNIIHNDAQYKTKNVGMNFYYFKGAYGHDLSLSFHILPPLPLSNVYNAPYL
jgi:hypothetical protein